ncbi:MAG: response regulator [Thermodesulfobacteriota bacterium]|nr:response regulator [Thermodesulfobacteriota bacterium]
MAEKKRILLIDDEKDLCFFLKANLENTGEFDVITSNSGHKGIKLAQKEKPDLILLDILMPEISGDEVAEILLEDPATAKIPIIFLTAMVTKEDVGDLTLKKRGGRNFIAKPTTTDEIVGAIKKVLEI